MENCFTVLCSTALNLLEANMFHVLTGHLSFLEAAHFIFFFKCPDDINLHVKIMV